MCECGGCLVECTCGDWCCPYCGCRNACRGCSEPERCGVHRGDVCPGWLGVPDVDYGPVWVEPITDPPLPPYGTADRAAQCVHAGVQQIGEDDWRCIDCGAAAP